MYGHLALRCRSHRQARAALRRLAGERVIELLSLRAVAVVRVGRRGGRMVRQSGGHGGAEPIPPGYDWAWWLMLSASVWCGGPVFATPPGLVSWPVEPVDEATIAETASRLSHGEAAVVMVLDEPTPLLVVEALRDHTCGVVASSLPSDDEELVSVALRQSRAA